ncbi:dihydroorotate dehydrogenase electron transfer subunit, partial [candidate division CSSED10-310 bacterium]
ICYLTWPRGPGFQYLMKRMTMTDHRIFKEKATIAEVQTPTPDSCLMFFESPQIAGSIKPGQFVNVLPPSSGEQFESYYHIVSEKQGRPGKVKQQQSDVALLRRPFSLHGIQPSPQGPPSKFSILFRIKGQGTQLISQRKPGEILDILGPLGHPLPLPFSAKQPVFIVAGGFGIAPLIPFAEMVVKLGHPVYFMWGIEEEQNLLFQITPQTNRFATLSEIGIDLLARQGIISLISIRLGGQGAFTGTVIELFDQFLTLETSLHHEPPVIYTCGPEMMMKMVTERARTKNWRCRVSMEKYMACGLGACLSCVCQMKKDNSFHYLRTCTDGPSFWGENIIW